MGIKVKRIGKREEYQIKLGRVHNRKEIRELFGYETLYYLIALRELKIEVNTSGLCLTLKWT
jgi:hypothetical protein